MHSIIFSLEYPGDENRDKLAKWSHAVDTVEKKSATISAVERIGKGVWMLTGEDALPSLGYMLRVAEDWDISPRALFVETATEWKKQKPTS